MKHPKRYTKETYSGASTIVGLLAGLILLCNRLTIPARIVCQAFLILLYAAACFAYLRIFDSLRDRTTARSRWKLAGTILLNLLTLFLIQTAIILLAVIPIIPLLFKSIAVGLGHVLWLRFQLHLLPKGADTT